MRTDKYICKQCGIGSMWRKYAKRYGAGAEEIIGNMRKYGARKRVGERKDKAGK